ncbi:pyrroline-5-carboxylate reductase [Campylobacter curvus]|uniref:pyrroline-5-carboxylate reductase n=1 Tax=Campylobacter curvus TaxID=200 RepID=UPI000360D7D7|nr:pyrroline-5-carboxylate reductase [Campylobacter curvus]QKF60414.1 pyrroline-5-carboxylate reductase [Campylobacter curvus]UEB50558.1 pyrroline-5-carboxylate reductase [Campylobacter curvus]
MKIGFIGGGNMGSAMIGSLVAGGVRVDEILVFARSKNETLRAKFGVRIAASEKEVANGADIVVIAVKPASYESVLKEISRASKFKYNVSVVGENTTQPIFITVAPNFSIQMVREVLGADAKVARTMPNMPSLIGEGVTAVNFSSNFTADERAAVMKILSYFGKTYEISEDKFAVFTAIAGSLPAYVFMFIEALADGAVLEGLGREIACEIACEAVAGSAKMAAAALKEGKHPARLKDEVCSPGGTTIEAVRVLENAKFRAAIIEAVSAVTRKAGK